MDDIGGIEGHGAVPCLHLHQIWRPLTNRRHRLFGAYRFHGGDSQKTIHWDCHRGGTTADVRHHPDKRKMRWGTCINILDEYILLLGSHHALGDQLMPTWLGSGTGINQPKWKMNFLDMMHEFLVWTLVLHRTHPWSLTQDVVSQEPAPGYRIVQYSAPPFAGLPKSLNVPAPPAGGLEGGSTQRFGRRSVLIVFNIFIQSWAHMTRFFFLFFSFFLIWWCTSNHPLHWSMILMQKTAHGSTSTSASAGIRLISTPFPMKSGPATHRSSPIVQPMLKLFKQNRW